MFLVVLFRSHQLIIAIKETMESCGKIFLVFFMYTYVTLTRVGWSNDYQYVRNLFIWNGFVVKSSDSFLFMLKKKNKIPFRYLPYRVDTL